MAGRRVLAVPLFRRASLPADVQLGHLLLERVGDLGQLGVLAAGRLQLVGQLLQLRATGHEAGQLGHGDLVLLPVAEAAAPLEDQEAVADRVGVVRVVGDEDDPQAALLGLDDVAQHHPGLLDAQGRGRLVQDQHLGPEVHRPGDGHALALAARQRADRLVDVAQVDAHVEQLLLGRLAHAGDVHGRALADLVAEEEVAPHRHQRHHRQVLVDGGDAAVEGLAGRVEVHVLALDLVGAVGVLVQPGDDLDQGRLAGPVVPKAAGHLGPADLEGDALEGDDVAVVLAGVGEPDQRRFGPGVGCGGHLDASARCRMKLLNRMAPSSRAPRKK